MKLFAYINEDEIVAQPLSREFIYQTAVDFCSYLEHKYQDKGWVLLEKDVDTLLDKICESQYDCGSELLIKFMNERNVVGDIYYFPQILEI